MSSYLESLFSLQGKTALVTGATRGIGQAITIALAKAGADIISLQRNVNDRSTVEQIAATSTSCSVTVLPCNLADKEQVGAIVRKITNPQAEGGLGINIDILVNCGGIQRRHPAAEFPDSEWEEVLQVNLNAVWTLSRDVGRHMLETRKAIAEKTGREPDRGKIISFASLLSYQGGLTVPAYAAAKHGVLGMTKALSNEWSSQGINVNCIAPGYIATEMNTALINNPTRSRQIMERIPEGRWGTPQDFEGIVLFLASRASDYVSGETIVVDGGWMGR